MFALQSTPYPSSIPWGVFVSHEGKAVSEGLVSIILFHLTTAAVEEKVFIMFLATKNKQFL